MRLGAIAASGVGTYPLDHVPQFLGIDLLATGDISKVIVTTDVDGTFVNLNDAALKALAQSMKYTTGAFSTGQILYIPLSDGVIQGRKCTIEVTAGVGASGVEVFDTSRRQSTTGIVYRSTMQDVLANGGYKFNMFKRLFILSMGTSDVVTINSNNGASMQVTKRELASLGAMVYNNSNEVAIVENVRGEMRDVTVSPTAQRTCVILQESINGAVTPIAIQATIENNRKVAQKVQKAFGQNQTMRR